MLIKLHFNNFTLVIVEENILIFITVFLEHSPSAPSPQQFFKGIVSRDFDMLYLSSFENLDVSSSPDRVLS
jgi:hypothetical protein